MNNYMNVPDRDDDPITSVSNDSETEEQADNVDNIDNEELENVPEITEITLTKKETFYYKIIRKYYKSLSIEQIKTMIDIIYGKSKISLRLLDWFVTRYADKYKTRFERTEGATEEADEMDKKIDRMFNVHISYKAQLKSYKKRYFDPFRRRKKFKYYFDKEKTLILCTTICQLNFFRWAFTNEIIKYVTDNYAKISKAMVSMNKIEKTKKIKLKSTNASEDEVTIDKHNINITAQKKVKDDQVKIILTFD
jgi:hypothetical protein